VKAQRHPTLSSIEEMNQGIKQLVSSYASVLLYLQGFGVFHVFSFEIEKPNSFLGKLRRFLKPYLSFIVAYAFMPAIIYLVNSHVQTRLAKVIAVLQLHKMQDAPLDREKAKALEMVVEFLKEYRSSIPAGLRLGAVIGVITSVTSVSGVLATVLIFLRNPITQAFFWNHTALSILILIMIYLFLIEVIYFCFILSAFYWKRTLFVGSAYERIDSCTGKTKTIQWDSLPTIKVYEVENNVFRLLGVQKPREFPLDLVFNVYWHLPLGLALTYLLAGIYSLRLGDTSSFAASLLLVMVLLVLTIWILTNAVREYHRRVRTGQI